MKVIKKLCIVLLLVWSNNRAMDQRSGSNEYQLFTGDESEDWTEARNWVEDELAEIQEIKSPSSSCFSCRRISRTCLLFFSRCYWSCGYHR